MLETFDAKSFRHIYILHKQYFVAAFAHMPKPEYGH